MDLCLDAFALGRAVTLSGDTGIFAYAKTARRVGLQKGETGMQRQSAIYLISCVGKKRSDKMQAKELYASEWFFRSRAFVERTGCAWFILSARFGLVAPEQTIQPYEQTLNA